MSDDETTSYNRIQTMSACGNDCSMGEMLMEIRDTVNYMVQEQKHIKADVKDMKEERRSVIFGILVGLLSGLLKTVRAAPKH
jgi:hypothetical protein